MEIGIFCGPEINSHLQRYFQQLGHHDVVVGTSPEQISSELASQCFLLFIADEQAYQTINFSMPKNPLFVWVYFSQQRGVIPEAGIFCYLDLAAPAFICRQNLQLILSNVRVLQEQRRLAPMAQQLQGMVAQSLEQLQKLKKFSEKIVPLRHEGHGPIGIFFKYGAGGKVGGDFYDLVTKKHFLYLFLFHTKSYLVSSSIMTRITQWAVQPAALELSALLAQMMPEIASYRAGPQDAISHVACIALAINLKTLQFQGHVFGNLKFIFANQADTFTGNEYPFEEPFLSNSQVQGVFSSNSTMTVCSPGVMANMGGDWPAITQLAKKNQFASERDYCNEFFIAMSRYKTGDFYQNDASVVFLKVDKHALFEI